MIRINLLPRKKARKQDAGQKQILYMGAALAGWFVLLTFYYLHKEGERDTLVRENQTVQAEIDRLKAELGDYDKIKAQREELLKQQETIKALESKRTGPVFLLREVSEILTRGKGPTFDRVLYEELLRRDPNAGFNAAWDTRRVWIESYDEEGLRVRIKGGAKSNEDVAEFLKRLQASVFFKEVVLESTSQVSSGGKNAIKHMNFNLSTAVVF
jgi:type IV pilus assembly protein PilN